MMAWVSLKEGDHYPLGTSHNTITGDYKTYKNLLNFGVPKAWRQKEFKLEIHNSRDTKYGLADRIEYWANGRKVNTEYPKRK